MGFLDFNHASTSRKLLMDKRRADGLEAPRNSLEFPLDASQSRCDAYENILVKQSSRVNTTSSGTPIKKLIDEEMSKKANARRSSPSVVARLMGVDALPLETKPSDPSKERGHEKSRNNTQRQNSAGIGSSSNKMLDLMPVRQRKEDMHPCSNSLESDHSSRVNRPRPREHPQEELLQQFKKDFEAWQSNKLWERSKAVGLDCDLQPVRQRLTSSQGNLCNEKMVMDVKHSSRGKTFERANHNLTATLDGKAQGFTSRHEEIIGRLGSRDNGHSSAMESIGKRDKSLSPTRIVILKPCCDYSNDMTGTWACSPEMIEREGSMKDFLEEVREKLRLEIHGEPRYDPSARGSMPTTSSRDQLNDPKQIAQRIARQIREGVSRDLGATLMRSESSRSYKSEVQLNGPNSTEFIKRDTRKFLSERLKNILRNEGDNGFSTTVHEKPRMPLSVKEGVRVAPITEFSNFGKRSCWEDERCSTEGGSFRQAQQNNAASYEELSPRNLVRSLSAPVSGASFGKLISEDQHGLSVAHIRRKHETTENTSVSSRKNRRDGFNFKGTVSNLKHNLTLRGKFFSKRTPPLEEPDVVETDPVRTPVTVPFVMTKSGIGQENLTEVPPSPASISSSSHDDFCKPSHPSPVSPLDAPFMEERPSPQITEGINSNIPDSSPSDAFEILESEQATEVKLFEESDMVNISGQEEAYIRDILITAGLFEKESGAGTLSKWEILSQPIASSVFEEVEEVYSKHEKTTTEGSLLEDSISHKLLFDLLNETLSGIVGPLTNSSAIKRFTSTTTVLHGKKLLDAVWHEILILLRSLAKEPNSMEILVEQDVRKNMWPSTVHKETDGVGAEVGAIILEQLLDEFVWELSNLITDA